MDYMLHENRMCARFDAQRRAQIRDDERRARWRSARQRPVDEKIARPAPATGESRAMGRGGRRTSRRVGRAGGGGGGSKSSDGDGEGGGEPPHPQPGAGGAILDIHGLAARWLVSPKTLQNRISFGDHLPPPVVLPGARGPRWRLIEIERFEAAAQTFRDEPPRRRGRPRKVLAS
jgi:hypothetical protein